MSRPQIAALQWKLSLNIAQLLAILLTAFGCGIAASVIFGPNQGAASPWIQRASASKDALSTGDTPPATCIGAGRNDYFPLSMNRTYEEMLEYQALLESKTPQGRGGIMGNILWSAWQTFYYGAQAANPCIRTICEIGFGAGHSTVLFTSVNPHVHIYSFDVFDLGPYQDAAVAWHKHSPHGHRLTTIKGKSQDTVPQYAKQHPELKCDIVHVDGDHISPNAYIDIKNFKAMAHQHTIVLADDANEADVLQDMQRAVDEGITEPWEVYVAGDVTDSRFTSLPRYTKHFSMTRYKWPSAAEP